MREKSDFFFLGVFAKKYFFIPLPQTFKPQNIKDMKELVAKIQAEYANFAVNDKAAGTRARKSALELSKLMKEFRKVSIEATK